ncbi:hypothetical protein ESB00_05380 [Oleiharenicola lentus]|uniref:Uncharacterized protein n=1 Tax=Oleiharenicola lentus TaxID=2508720 RepID=A0A4Q1C938_9BACT|nr:hypothetical protein [Oleiharenicola lentus]RXK55331.1 hypothetical protein ESB00_05380 [Oleiharenicola lentus]
MKRKLWLIPLLGLAAFAIYYQHWNTLQAAPRCHSRCTDPTAAPVDEFAHRDGRKEATADLRRGRLTILTYGLPAPWSLALMEVLHRDHGIELRTVAGCIVTKGQMRYVDEYNEVMERHLTAIHGEAFFD